MTEAVTERVEAEAHEERSWLRTAEPQGFRQIVVPLLPFAGAVVAALLLHRLGGEIEPSLEDRARLAIARAGDEISERAWKLGRDERAERRKQRAWSLLQGGVGAGFTLLARRAAAGAWEGLTGRDAPRR